MKKAFGICFSCVAMLMVTHIVLATAPAPSFLFHLFAMSIGFMAATLVSLCFGKSVRWLSKWMLAAGAAAGFWPTVALVAATF